MKKLLLKSLSTLGIAACAVGTFTSVSHASIAWDSDANYIGSGGKASVIAYSSQANEPKYYKISVSARTNDGTSRSQIKNPASTNDRASVSFTTNGAISSGSSDHEWVMVGDSANVHKTMDIH